MKIPTVSELAGKLRAFGRQHVNESMRSSRRRRVGRRPGSLEQLESRVLLTAGDLDLTFGTGGKVVTNFGPGSTSDDVRYDGSMALQADGKILVAGNSANNFALARYNTDGTLDTSFDGDGKVTTDFGSVDFGYAVAVQSDGKIVVAGSNNNQFALARYNTNGSLDTSFDGDGKLTTQAGTSFSEAYTIAVQADGKILAAGTADDASGNFLFAVVRYNSNGTLDTGFDGDGKAFAALGAGNYDLANSIAVQADGKILLAGSSFGASNDDFGVARFNTNGSLDTSFSGDGKLTTTFGTGTEIAYSVAVQADAKIVVGGLARPGSDDDFGLVRYNTDGSLDTSFDGDGKVTTSFGVFNDYAHSVVVQADGKIVAAGVASITIPNGDFALARYNTNGSLDATFGTSGKVTTAVQAGFDTGYSLAIQSDGKFVVGGSSTGSSFDFAVVRYQGDPTGTLSAAMDGSNNLVITDTDGTGKNNSLTISNDGSGSIVISDAAEQFASNGGISGAVLSNGNKTLTVPVASITGTKVIVNSALGNDVLNASLANSLGKILDFNGGTGGSDKLTLSGGSTTSQTFNFTNENDGSVVLAGAIAGTVNYTGLEPVSSSISATDVILNYSTTTEVITVTQDGTDATLTKVDSNVAGESVSFVNPSGSLQINGGNTGDDTVTVTSFGTSGGGFSASLTINGGTGNDTVNLNADITFASGKNLDVDLQNDDAAPGTDVINVGTNANLILSGSGAATLKGSKSIALASGSSITTVNGTLTLSANQQATPTGGNFFGIEIDGGTISTSGTGNILLEGRGGNSGSINYGIRLLNGARVESTATGATAGTVTLSGTGGAAVSFNVGVAISSAATLITSRDGAILIAGLGGSDGSDGANSGLDIDAATISSTGTGANAAQITIMGTGGNGTYGNHGALLAGNAMVTSVDGDIAITGTGGTGTTVNNLGVYVVGAHVSSTGIVAGAAAITVTGTPGPDGNGPRGIYLQLTATVTSIAAPITLIGDSMNLEAPNAINAGVNTATFKQKTNTKTINLGGADGTDLGLTNTELTHVTAGTVQIGDSNSGAITVSADISPANYKTLAIGNDLTFASTGGFSSDVGPTAATFEKISVTGTVAITAGATLAVAATGGYVFNAADSFTFLTNDAGDLITGTFTGPTLTNFLGSALTAVISYTGGTGNDLVISGPTNAAPTAVVLTPTSASLAENASTASATVLSTISVTDDGAGTNVLSLTGTDASSFEIVGNSLRLKAGVALDFETKPTYTVTVEVDDASVGGAPDASATFTLNLTNSSELSGIDVQKGQVQRSFVRYLDILFDVGGQDLLNLISGNRLQLTRYDLDGLNGVVQALPVAPAPVASGSMIQLDFGIQGIGGNRGTNAGDGYYEIALDMDGNGSFESKKYFHRLFGDVTGNGIIDAADKSQVLAAQGVAYSAESDVNGDGVMNVADTTLVTRAISAIRKLKNGLLRDD